MHVTTRSGPANDVEIVDEDGNEYIGTGSTLNNYHVPIGEEQERQFTSSFKIIGPGDLPTFFIQQVGRLLFDADGNFIEIIDVHVNSTRCLP